VRAVFLAALAWIAVQPPSSAVRVGIDTELGRLVIDVDVAHAPATSANFLKYVNEQFYDGGRFHRSVRPDTETRKDVPIQVIQGGINPARAAGAYAAIPLERTNATGLSHVDGAVSMARGAAADSARSDFFICIGDQKTLDFGGPRNADGQGFAVFGRVVSGMDVVRRIQAAPVRDGTQTLVPPIAIVRARVMEGQP
jgi:peptidyl-prolyl cis-trans isomerase A (cyclophilin A)